MLKKKSSALSEVVTIGEQQNGIVERQKIGIEQKLFLPSKNAETKINIDLIETEEYLRLLCNLPGIKPENLQVMVNRQMVHIVCEFDRQESLLPDGIHHYNERSHGRLERVVLLPALADVKSAKAVLENGVLNLKIKKTEMDAPVKLDIDYQLQHFNLVERE